MCGKCDHNISFFMKYTHATGQHECLAVAREEWGSPNEVPDWISEVLIVIPEKLQERLLAELHDSH